VSVPLSTVWSPSLAFGSQLIGHEGIATGFVQSRRSLAGDLHPTSGTYELKLCKREDTRLER
jgi:hypothetical protein